MDKEIWSKALAFSTFWLVMGLFTFACNPIMVTPKGPTPTPQPGSPTRTFTITNTPTISYTPTITFTPTLTFTPAPKRIFVTSTNYQGNLGGLSGADAICNARAAAATLGGTWVAFLDTSTTTAVSRIPYATWIRMDGVTVFNSTNDIAAGANPLVPPDLDEFGNPATIAVWTGVPSDNCSNWTSNSGGLDAGVGFPDYVSPCWYFCYSYYGCEDSICLYCLEK